MSTNPYLPPASENASVSPEIPGPTPFLRITRWCGIFLITWGLLVALQIPTLRATARPKTPERIAKVTWYGVVMAVVPFGLGVGAIRYVARRKREIKS